MSKLIDLYTNILEYCGLRVDTNGNIYAFSDDKKEPLLINSKALVLPLDNILKNPKPDEQIIFHPLAENTLRMESEVIMKLKKSLNVRMNYAFGMIASNIFTMALNKDINSKMNPDQLELIRLLKDVDETSQVNFHRVMTSLMKIDYEKTFVNVFLKKGGFYKGKKFARVGIINFPLYTLLKEKGVNAVDFKIRPKDVKIIMAMYEYIFPNINDPEGYNYGSNNDVAPYLDSLLNSTIKILASYNTFIETYKEFMEHADAIYSNSDWVDDFSDLNSLLPLIRAIPPQLGNVGTTNLEKPVSVSNVPTPPVNNPQYAPPPQPQPVQQPVQQPQPQYQQPTYYNPIAAMNNIPAAINPNQPAAINPNPQTHPNPYQQPNQQQPQYQHPQSQQPQYQQPQPNQQPQYQQPEQPQIVKTERGLDFRSLRNAIPALQATPNVFAGMMPQNPGMNPWMGQQQAPGWANPQMQNPYGQPMYQNPGMNQQAAPGWSQPQMQNPYGQPMYQNPGMNPWMGQQQAPGWGQPQMQNPYGQPMYNQPGYYR